MAHVLPDQVFEVRNLDMGYTTSDQPIPSIFLNASIANATDPRNKHMINTAGTMTSQLNCASTFLKNDGEALFAFFSNAGNLLLVKMPPVDKEGGVVQQFELAQSSMMKKLWSGIMRSNQDVSESPTSIVVQPFKGDPYIFTVCRDYKLRIWSANTLECVFVFNMLDLRPEKAQTHPTPYAGHLIQKVLSNDDSNLRFSVYLNFPNGNQFVHIQPDVGRMHVHHIETISGNEVFHGDYTVYSPKRLYDGIEKQEIMMKKLEIVELVDIKTEFMLVDARLRLYGKESDQGFHSGPISRPDEIVGQLVTVGLYDRAVIISHLFDLKLHTVMESLALRCVNLARSNVGIMATDCYDWLQDNNVTLSCVMQNSR
ncbi:NUP160 [Mytilus coruscus]|uniref:NUP160 n=1 Tax=Mytilus coruscus TaxID=42192 RepID=A0A6J8AEI5_MYTCO|nr:NUP160 [Mytilus coruscus]